MAIGRISLGSLHEQLNTYNAQSAQARAQAAQANARAAAIRRATPPAPPPSGPTGFWGRIATIGVGKVNAYNLDRTLVQHKSAVQSNSLKQNIGEAKTAGRGVNKAGKFLFEGSSKLINQGYQEGKQGVDTIKMAAATRSKNTQAFRNAQKQSQKDYQGFNREKGGLFNAGTATSAEEAKKGQLKTGLKRIGGSTLESAGELVPLAAIGKAGKVYKAGKGLLKAGEAGAKKVAKQAVVGAVAGATGQAGGELANEGKVGLKDVGKAAGLGAAQLEFLRPGAKIVTKAGEKVISKKAIPVAEDTVSKSADKLIQDVKQAPSKAARLSKNLRKPTISAAKMEDQVVSNKVVRPSSEPKVEEPLVNTNKPVKSLVNKLTPKSLSGKLNPVDAAARKGHTTFSNTIRNVAGRKVYALRQGHLTADKFDKAYAEYLAKGGTHKQFIQDIESGKLSSDAHKLWNQIHESTGKQLADLGITKGAKANYVGRVGQFTPKGYKRGGAGLSKSGSFAKSRAQVSDEFGIIKEDKYKTHEEYKNAVEANGGKVLSDPRDILRHTLPAKLEAIENAKGLANLDKTPMADGRPATITFNQSKGLPKNYNDYNANLVQGRAVHPEAAQTLNALVHTYTPGEVNNPIAKANSFAKQIITLNGLIHAKNFGLASLRKQGAIHTAQAVVKWRKDLGKTFGEENIKRAVVKGGLVPFEQNKQDMFDRLTNQTATKTWDKAVHWPGKFAEHERDMLFNKFGNHMQFSTYFNVEKQMIKKGLSPDEAARVAGQAAKNVSFISSPVETSVEYRKASRIVFFAGQYFKSTLNEAAKAAGISRDASLSAKAQTAAQKNAIKGIARGMTYLLATAQGINYATTGHSTFQNKDSKISPVFYIDPKTGKEYHVSNWYGQLGDMMHMFGNPIHELSNKSSPIFQEGSRLYSAIQSGAPDPFTGQTIIDKNASGARQTSQAIGNFLQNMVSPFGFQLSPSQRSSPAMVTMAKLLGYGTSTVDQNTMEKDVLNRYYQTLPAGASKVPPATSMLEAIARNDLAHGRTNSTSVQQLKSQMSPTQFKSFMKTGSNTQVQRAYDKLPNDQKLQIIEKYNSKQLKELDLSSIAKAVTASSQRATVTALESKGYSPQRISRDLQKAGYNRSQLDQFRAEAKKQSSQRSKVKRSKFVNPLL